MSRGEVASSESSWLPTVSDAPPVIVVVNGVFGGRLNIVYFVAAGVVVFLLVFGIPVFAYPRWRRWQELKERRRMGLDDDWISDEERGGWRMQESAAPVKVSFFYVRDVERHLTHGACHNQRRPDRVIVPTSQAPSPTPPLEPDPDIPKPSPALAPAQPSPAFTYKSSPTLVARPDTSPANNDSLARRPQDGRPEELETSNDEQDRRKRERGPPRTPELHLPTRGFFGKRGRSAMGG
ncbi:hypothetical protein HDU96_000171 [Phlyctochytrium bullatum]|nr:hypothetical protein HDU96_000171 [Phlyctochytrium bullatum]